jgi:CubicO group peptidase (beta-lactamase class C family)
VEILAKSTPEQQGVSSAAVKAFVDEADETLHNLHSLMFLRHGQIFAEGWWSPYAPEDPHILFSLSKSFTSTAVGLAVAEGKLKVTDPVISFFPADMPKVVGPNLAAMQVRHLLTMTTGHDTDATPVLFKQPDLTWVQAFLSLPVEHEPGTHFAYNTAATYMLSAIVQKVTGQALLEYLQPRLFTPLGIEPPSWEFSPQGINTGSFGLSLTTAEVARFGQLYLQKGVWRGRQLIPAQWVADATSGQVSNGTDANSDWNQGYGYQFWRCRHGAYRGDGAFGQFCIVLPEQDAVLVFTAGLEDTHAVLNLVWKHLLPAMKPERLPEDPTARQVLTRKLDGLSLVPEKSVADGAAAHQVSGKAYTLAENDYDLKTVSFDFDRAGCILTIGDVQAANRLEIGDGSWRKSELTLNGLGPRKVAASGGWTAPDSYLIQLYFLTPVLADPQPRAVGDMPFSLTLTCQFNADRVRLEQVVAPSFQPGERPALEGYWQR